MIQGYNISLDLDLYEELLDLLQSNLTFKALRSHLRSSPFFEFIGGGTARHVYRIKGTPYVLKVAFNQKGVAQNDAEVDVIRHSSATYIIPELYAFFTHERYHGQVVASVLKYYPKVNSFREWLFLLNILDAQMNKEEHAIVGGQLLSNRVYSWIGIKKYSAEANENKLIERARSLINVMNLRQENITDEEILKLHENVFSSIYVEDMEDLVVSFDLSPADIIRYEQWGKDGNVPKLLDLGLTGHVYNEFYLKNRF